MPGLVGCIDDRGADVIAKNLELMVDALEHEPRFKRELLTMEHAGLGRASLRVTNPGVQPVWNDERTVFLVMEGEFFDHPPLPNPHILPETFPVKMGFPHAALALYEKYGEGFADRINGEFLIALYDQRKQTLILTNDRLGTYPAYTLQTAHGLYFASGVRALTALPDTPRSIDHTAIAEFLTFDHVLGQRTLLKGIDLLPGSSVFTREAGSSSLRRYWEPSFPNAPAELDEDALYEEFAVLLKRAVQRRVADGKARAILLSGGMDSRAILGAYREITANGSPLTLTWGLPGSDDTRFASEASRAVGAEHHFTPLEGAWLERLGSEGVRITDGMANLVNLPALPAVEKQSKFSKIMLKGFLGDAMFGFGMRPRYWATYKPEDRLRVHLEAYRDYRVFTWDPNVHHEIFTPSFLSEVGGQVFDDYRFTMDASGVESLADQRIYIDFRERVPRMTVNGLEATRQHADVRLPFCDHELIDFSLRVPAGLRLHRNIFIEGFIRAFPALAKIPVTPGGLPLMSCARDVQLRAKQWLHWHLERRGFTALLGLKAMPKTGFASQFRTSLRPWVESVLLDSTSLNRGYLKPEAIQSVVREHMAGADHSVRLGALLSLELWHKLNLD